MTLFRATMTLIYLQWHICLWKVSLWLQEHSGEAVFCLLRRPANTPVCPRWHFTHWAIVRKALWQATFRQNKKNRNLDTHRIKITILIWSEWQDSNLRHPAPEDGAILDPWHKATTKLRYNNTTIIHRKSSLCNRDRKWVTSILHAFNTNSTCGNGEETKNRWNPVVSPVFVVEISGIEPLTSWMLT